MGEDLNFELIFALWGKPGEKLDDDDWIEEIQDMIDAEQKLVGRHEWDSGAPGAGAGTVDVFRFRDFYFAYNDVAGHGPYETFKEAADAVQFYVKTDATTRIWVDPSIDEDSDDSSPGEQRLGPVRKH